jgi:hypothetical protein
VIRVLRKADKCLTSITDLIVFGSAQRKRGNLSGSVRTSQHSDLQPSMRWTGSNSRDEDKSLHFDDSLEETVAACTLMQIAEMLMEDDDD